MVDLEDTAETYIDFCELLAQITIEVLVLPAYSNLNMKCELAVIERLHSSDIPKAAVQASLYSAIDSIKSRIQGNVYEVYNQI